MFDVLVIRRVSIVRRRYAVIDESQASGLCAAYAAHIQSNIGGNEDATTYNATCANNRARRAALLNNQW